MKIGELYELLLDADIIVGRLRDEIRRTQERMCGFMREDEIDPTNPKHQRIIICMNGINDLVWDLSLLDKPLTDKPLVDDPNT